MVRARTRKFVGGEPRHSNVTQLAMRETAHRPTVGDEPNADTRADGHVGEVVKALAGSPAHFREGSAVDVCVEPGRHHRASPQLAKHIGSRPTRFRSAGDVTELRRTKVEI